MQIQSLLLKIKQQGLNSLSTSEREFLDYNQERARPISYTQQELVIDYECENFFIKDRSENIQHIADLLLEYLPWYKYKPVHNTYNDSILFSPIYDSLSISNKEIDRIDNALEKVIINLNKDLKTITSINCNIYSSNDPKYVYHPMNGLSTGLNFSDNDKNYLSKWVTSYDNLFSQYLLPIKESLSISDSLYFGNKFKRDVNNIKSVQRYYTFSLESLFHSI